MIFSPNPTPDPETGAYNPRDFAFAEPLPVYGTVLLSILLVATFFLFIFVMYRLIKFRHSKLIEPRAMATFLPLQTMTFVNLVVFSVSIMLGKPDFCYTLDALYLITPVLALHYNYNIPVLVFQSELNAMKMDRGHSGEQLRAQKWLKLCTIPYRALYFVISSIGAVGIYLLLKVYGNIDGDCNREAQLTTAIIVLFLMLLLGYFLVKSNKIKDPYYLKLENDLGTCFTLIPLFLMIAYPIGPSIFGDWFDYRWSFICTSITNLYFNALFEAMLTFDWFVLKLEKMRGQIIPEDQIKEADTLGSIFALSQGMDLFQAILANPTMLEAFTQFTIKEWSVENVLFYKGVDEFKELFRREPKQGRTLAASLVQEYVVNGAPLEVNIEHQVRKLIIRELDEGLCETTFDQAQKNIYDLMKKDTFEKWRKTADFKDAIQALVTLRKSNQSDSKDGSRGSGSKVHSSREQQVQSHRNEDSTEMVRSSSRAE